MNLKGYGLLCLLDANDGVLQLSQIYEYVNDGKDSIASTIKSLVKQDLVSVETITLNGKYAGKRIVKCGKSAFPYILTSNYKYSKYIGNAENPKNGLHMEKQSYVSKLKNLITKRFSGSWLRSRAKRANCDVPTFIDSFSEYAYGAGIEWADNKGSLLGLEKLIKLHAEICSSKPVRPSYSEENTEVDLVVQFSDKVWQRASNELERDLLKKGLAKGVFNKDQLIAFAFVAKRLGSKTYHQNWEKICANNFQEWKRLYEPIPEFWKTMNQKPEIDEKKL